MCPFHLADPALTVSLPLVKDMVEDIVYAMEQPPNTDGILIPPVIAAHRLVKMTSGAKLKHCMSKKETKSTLKVLHYYQYIITEGTRHGNGNGNNRSNGNGKRRWVRREHEANQIDVIDQDASNNSDVSL